MKFVLLSVAVCAFSTLAFAQSPQRRFKPEDVLNERNLSDPRVSPDDKWVAYVLSEVDTAKDKSVSHLWMQSLTTGESIELTHGSEDATAPRWSPDGKYLSFLSPRDSKNGSQIWVMDRRGGEAKKLTDIKGDINGYEWSPDASKLVLLIQDPENNGKEEPKTPLPIRLRH